MTEAAEMNVGTIFCATDFSDTSALALRHAVRLAERHAARLVLGHVVEPLPVAPYPMPISLDVGEAAIHTHARERLEAAGASVRKEGLIVETQFEIGVPGSQLVELARKADADLVVIGTRGLSGLKHLVLGSTAEYVVRRAHSPVLTIHPDDNRMLDTVKRIIVATDLSEDADHAADAFDLLFSRGDRPQVELIFADSTPPYLESMSHERLEEFGQPDARMEEIEGLLSPLVARFEARGFDVVLRVLDGGPVEAITGAAEERDADLILMSTHGRSALVNALLGRTAQRVVQHAPCPVLTVCPKRRRFAGLS